MKTIIKHLYIIIIILIAGCGEDIVNNGNPPENYHLYYNKLNSSLRRFESYTIKMDGSSSSPFIDSLAVTSCSYNGKITLAKLDTASGFFFSSLFTADL